MVSSQAVHSAEDPDRSWLLERRGKVVLAYSPETEHMVVPTWDSLERSFSLIEDLLGWSIDQELTVVISDHLDVSNGWARVLPYPDIHLLVFPPPLDSALAGPGAWWDRLVLHELLHVTHLLRAGGVHALLNKVLGPIDYPNQRLPRWFIEGLAVWVESHDGVGGRLNHPAFLGRKRITLMEQPPLSIDRLTTGPIDPPGGTAAYMFGADFVRFLAGEYGGARALKAFVEKYGRDFWPFGLNRTWSHVSGISFLEAYERFMSVARQQAMSESVGRGGKEAVGRTFVSQRINIRDLRLRFGERELVSLESDGHHETQIVVRRIDDGQVESRQKCVGGCGGGMSLSANGRMALVSTLTPVGPVRSTGDLYWYSLGVSKEPTRWTHDAHLARPDAHRYPGLPVLAVRTLAGASEVVALPGPDFPIEVVIAAKAGLRVDMPRWSHQSETLVYVEMDRERSRLVFFNTQTRERRVLATSTWPFLDPVFGPDDNSVFVSGAVDGVYDVLEIRLDTGEIYRRSKSIGGTAHPVPMSQNEVLFADMRGYGWSVQHRVLKGRGQRVELDLVAMPAERTVSSYRPQSTPPPSQLSLARPRTILPTFNYVSGQGTNLGFSLAGRDPVDHHQWAFFLQSALGIRSAHRVPDWGGHYTYGGLPFDLSIGFLDVKQQRFGFDGSCFHGAEGRSRRTDLSVWFDKRQIETRDRLGLSTGLRYDSGDSPFLRPDPGGQVPTWLRDEFRPSLGLHFRRYGRRSVRYGSVPEYGYSMGTSLHYQPSLSAYRAERWRLHWFFVAPMTFSRRHHVVMTHRFHGKLSFAPRRSRETFKLGGLETRNLVADYFEGTTEGYESLRGFPVGAFKGHHVQGWNADLALGTWNVLKGVGTWPLALRRVTPALFADFGWIGPFRLDQRDVHLGVGMELRFETEIGFGFHQILRAGFGHGFGSEGIPQAYLVWGTSP